MMRKFAIAGATVAIAALGVAVPGGAQAADCGSGSQTGTTNADGVCQQQGSYVAPAALALETDLAPFSIANSNTSLSTEVGAGNLFVGSNDSAGYQITVSSSPWVTGSVSTGGDSFNASDLSTEMYSANGASWTATPFANSGAETFATCDAVSGDQCLGGIKIPGVSTTPPGYDDWPVQGYWFNLTPAGIQTGTYSATIEYILWGN
jgi:hypothetical protein